MKSKMNTMNEQPQTTRFR